MTTLTLGYIIESLGGTPPAVTPEISQVVFDSREVTPGAVFVALPGEKVDGHDFVGSALDGGAVAAIVDRDLDLPCHTLDLRAGAAPAAYPESPCLLLRVDDALTALQNVARKWCHGWLQGGDNRRIIGITGSVGKTTTKELAADVLATRYQTLRSEKSYNNEIGIPITVLNLRDHHQRAVLEMSMYVPGEIDLLTSIAPPQVGVVTLIAPVHAERAGSLEAIINAKSELVKALPPDPDGCAVLNYDDENVMLMADRTDARVFTYGIDPRADLSASQIVGMGLDGIRFWLHHEGQRYHVRLPLLGQHSVHTALRAAAVGLVEGLVWDEIIAGLQSDRAQLRLLAVKGPRGSIVLDDTYNASPPSTIAALNLLDDLPNGRRIAVLGDMLELGPYETQGHRDVGIRASGVADLLVTVGERARIIGEAALNSRMPRARVKIMTSAEDAAAYLLDEIQPGDTVLVKGSRVVGMERIVAALQQAAGEPGD